MKTNLLKTGATPDLCPPVTPIECGTEGEIFNSSTLSNSVRVCLAAGEVAQLTAFKLAAGNTIKVFIDAKGNGVECADCGPDDRVPLMDCDGCHQNQLNEFKRQTYVVGPNCFVFVSDSPVGEPFVTMTKVTLDQVPPEFICQEPCYPPVTATVSICPVPNCFTWRGKKYLNLADFVADVQTIVTGATYDAATCTFSAPAGSTFPDLTIVACVPCPPLTISAVASGQTSAVVTITGGPATVSISGDCCAAQEGNGPFTFTGLTSGTRYVFTAVSKCGTPSNTECDGCEQSTATTELTTDACPAVVLTQTANTPNSVTISSNIAATVTLGSQEAVVAAGGSHTFTELKELTNYTVKAITECGAKTVFTATTAACPAISLTQTANTTSSITVTLVTGGSASVFVGADEVVLSNGASHTFTSLTAGKTYTAKVVSACGNKASFPITTAACPAVDFTATTLSTTSLEVTAIAGTPLDVSIVSQGGAVLDAIYGLMSTIVFTDLPEGAIVTVKAVNECGKKKQLNVNLPDPVANPCPSFSLADASPYFKGFAYVAGDLIDPAATVAYRGGFIYPAAGEGHTVKVTDNLGAVIGYAVNKSDCANPCCTPITNRTSVDGDIIIDGDDNYYIQGEVNKCDGTPVLPTDRLFNKGSLKTCVNGALVDLDCNMIVKTIDSCCEPTVYVGDSGSGGSYGICAILAPTGYDGIGRMAFQSRDASIILGSANVSGGAPAYFQKTYTNPSNCKAYLRIDAQVFANYVTDQAISDSKAVFVHTIGEELNIVPPNFGAGALPVRQNWAWTPIYQDTPNASVGVSDPMFPLGVSSQASNMLVFEKMLNPNETITLYGQWWAVLYNNGQTLDSLHGGMYISEKLFLNAGEF